MNASHHTCAGSAAVEYKKGPTLPGGRRPTGGPGEKEEGDEEKKKKERGKTTAGKASRHARKPSRSAWKDLMTPP